MRRLRLYDMRNGELPKTIGLCASDIRSVAQAVNTAQRRLLYAREASDEGWWGTWAEIVFNVSRATPYITLPREVARLSAVLACDRPINVENQWYEYLNFGNGRLPKQFEKCDANFITQCLTRNNAVTFTDLVGPAYVQMFVSEASDVGKRVLIQGLDQNSTPIISWDGVNRVQGQFVRLEQPFAVTPMLLNQLTGIQKDITDGPIQFFQLNPTTGVSSLILTMQPSEQTALYRRYFFADLPCGCCPVPAVLPGTNTCANVQVTAIAKLELIPVIVDTDYCLIQNEEAIIEEAQSKRYSIIDTPTAKQMAQEKHAQAIRLLNGELNHYLGMNSPAVNVAPFGSARLERQRIGTMI